MTALLLVFGCRGEERGQGASAGEQAAGQLIEQASETMEEGRDVAAELQSLLRNQLGERISDLQVEIKDGTVTLSGVCDSEATRKAALTLVSNFDRAADVSYDKLTVRSAGEPPAAPSRKPAAETASQQTESSETYVVRPGDWLSKIAQRYYGNAMEYAVIAEANRDLVRNPDLIYPGQSLRIPKR
jgi:nucleoid-associated protein YgaU